MYKHVAILGVDGAGAFFADTDTPCMDALFANGAVTYEAITSIPTISAQCWGSMLLGVEPKRHKLTNEIVSKQPYDVNAPYPSIFRVVREAMPDAPMAGFCNWNPINSGIIEENLDVCKGTADTDAAVCQLVLDYLEQQSPTLLFVQFDEADGAGHKFGYGKKVRPYLDKITEIDALIGKIAAKYQEKGIADETLFVVSADHGGNRRHGHGGRSKAEKRIFIGLAGKDVPKGTLENMRVRDIASVAAAALGLSQPPSWTSAVPALLCK
ncbi:MAG: alkaline phosphatase [Oscillospiraceae bacterium]|jgi:predicted AlkP superfamily pyrophosphatase or phosphodiesterase|nr:alkaline phosphatase [Oscillospiraceae bacterium]